LSKLKCNVCGKLIKAGSQYFDGGTYTTSHLVYEKVIIQRSRCLDCGNSDWQVEDGFIYYRSKTIEELEHMEKSGGLVGYSARVELNNRTNFRKLKYLLQLIFLLAIGFSVWSFIGHVLK